jgi:tRNA(Ile)-lysidine synthase
MTGHKLVSDFMTDLKLPILQKRRQLVVTDRDGEILWLTGLRSDNRYRVSEQTTSVLRIALP